MSEPGEPARVPDVAHWLEGWRTWRVRPDGLQSLGRPYCWPARQAAHAECAHREQLWRAVGQLIGRDLSVSDAPGALAEHGPAPGRLCVCGLYARSTPPPWEDLPGPGYGFVVGRVALWGKIVRGATGMRAEYGYPLSLSDRRLAKRYGVPYDRTLARRSHWRFQWCMRWLMTANAASTALLPLFWFNWQWNPALWWVSTVALTTVAYLEWRGYQ